MKPRGSRFGILYSLCKVHKRLVDNCPPFRPIMSAIKIPTYNLAKFLVALLESITTNMYTVKKSFEFPKEIAGSGLFMASLDIEFLFTNIPLEEIISMYCDSLFSNGVKVNYINRIDFEKHLRAARQNNFSILKEKFIHSMGSPLGPTLGNAFLCFHEQIWLN